MRIDTRGRGERSGMRLHAKISLASGLLVAILAIVSMASLRAVGGLVSTNREISTRALPALTLTTSAREAIPRLRSLETRALVLRDTRYVTVWTQLAAQIAADLEELATHALSEAEALHVREASVALDAYRLAVAQERGLVGRGNHLRAQHLADSLARARADRLQASLEALMAATRTRVVAAQADAARLEWRTWTTVGIAFGVAVCLALFGTAIIARRMTRSLDRLSSATAQVAEGAFSDPLPVAGGDELAALARSFNAMASRLRELEATKEQFFSTITHELKSPLTSIRGAVELLNAGSSGALTERQQRLTAIIGLSSERLLRLANQILELSRLRAGALELDRRPLDLAELVDRVVEELHPQAEEAGVTLACERSGADFAYLGDEARLYQVVVNLGANAIRFTPPGGRVVVRILDAGPEFELQVEDTGAGIPGDALESIFDPYRQAHHDRGGTGLGLAIVRGIAHAHSGRVTAESREGKGSRFTVLLPRA